MIRLLLCKEQSRPIGLLCSLQGSKNIPFALRIYRLLLFALNVLRTLIPKMYLYEGRLGEKVK